MKIAYFDLIGGASGDMIMAAMLDAGLPEQALRQALAGLRLPGYELAIKRVVKNGFSATQVAVNVAVDVPERRLSEIMDLLEKSDLPEGIRLQAGATFARLAEVEAGIHGTAIEQVHLHELGGVDTVVDVCAALLGLKILGVERLAASPVPLGRGFVQGAHGQIPLPAPATVQLLQGVPVNGRDVEAELVTPTAAVLLTQLADSFGPIPSMRLVASGYGAGRRELPFPNLLRLLLGESAEASGASLETLATLETNIDDLNPEIYDYLISRLLKEGALDVGLSALQMKKNRPATQVWVLCRPPDAERLMGILFSETSTLGIRKSLVERYALERRILPVQTAYGEVRVKLARWSSGKLRAAPEYEDCRRIAAEQGVPLLEVYQAAQMAAVSLESVNFRDRATSLGEKSQLK
jgi:pyridinium-3,5-bisthiocarboxylic acid mononucleotide nickel chelatase